MIKKNSINARKKKSIILLIILFSLFLMILSHAEGKGNKNMSQSNISKAIIKTSQGIIEADLFMDKVPITAGNFANLAKEGFYNGLTFHRVEPGFVIQGGDPLGNGTGGSGKQIKLEIPCEDGRTIVGSIAPESCVLSLPHKKGTLSMARSQDPNSASSQFFITLNKTPFLDRSYAAFGYVTKGQDIAEKIKVGDEILSISIE